MVIKFGLKDGQFVTKKSHGLLEVTQPGLTLKYPAISKVQEEDSATMTGRVYAQARAKEEVCGLIPENETVLGLEGEDPFMLLKVHKTQVPVSAQTPAAVELYPLEWA